MIDNSDNSSALLQEPAPDYIAQFFDSVSAAKARGILLARPDNFEADFVDRMQAWARSPQYGIPVDSTTKDALNNVASFLADALFSNQPCPDPRTRLSRDELNHLLNFVG